MKRVLFLMVAAAVVLGACGDNNDTTDTENEGSNQENATEQESTQDNSTEEDSADSEQTDQGTDNPLDSMVSHFEEQGFELGEETMKAADMMGAVEGLGIELDGEEVELYQYESDSSDLEEIKSTGEYKMEDFPAFPAIANGNIVMIAHDEHSEGDSIVETFNNY